MERETHHITCSGRSENLDVHTTFHACEFCKRSKLRRTEDIARDEQVDELPLLLSYNFRSIRNCREDDTWETDGPRSDIERGVESVDDGAKDGDEGEREGTSVGFLIE